MRRRFTRKGLYLNAYSPGDGAIAFVWVDPNNQCVESHVTVGLIKKFLTHSDGKHLSNHSIQKINGQLRLVADIKRIGPDTLLVTDTHNHRTMTYSINPDPPFPNNLRSVDLDVKTALEGVGIIKVNHHSTLSSIAFFLNHESEIQA